MARDRKFSTDELFRETQRLLLEHGYEGFTFSVLAEALNVSRGTLYKYYQNREELITEFMLYEMNQFLFEVKEIDPIEGFLPKLNFLLNLMFKNPKLKQLIEIGQQVPAGIDEKVRQNKAQLEKLHLQMYNSLQSFIEAGRQEGILKPELPDALILGYIFQSVSIPNHFGIPQDEWIAGIRKLICYGMVKNN
ncbi:TetR family transcriptional regulator [Bacillus sp. FJAT-18017]|uniref:TetR/AcrR family transcriptional regulator n=1 Tax=Bacillus sp. FJAT-18017 TaxID=1705566 RepID=UPI0006AE1B2F|nr:TetR/AcrR family transcriptional regulator [Bacillus sp. FJAT-18017]ALC92217.1 TetR family transcriptional regulator [Bacillus sp. FJAT-18017]